MSRILLIVPSQAMIDIANKMCDEIGLVIPMEIVSNTQALEKTLKTYPDTEIFIARGSTVGLIQKATGKTVVEINFTLLDFLLPMHKLAMAGVDKFGVVVSNSVFEDKVLNYELGSAGVRIRTWERAEEVKPLVESLKASGVTGIVGDRTTVECAKECGLVTEFLNSGSAAIKKAILEAVQIANVQENRQAEEYARVQKIAQCADEIYSSLEHISAASQQLTASAQQLAVTSQEASNMVLTAANEVKNTSEILDMIRRVAQQTNLLGLNAAIEAARVGEQGRGFSVVANEVRKLAEESNHSVQDINVILEKIRTAVEQVLSNVAQNSEITQQQANAIQNIAQMVEGLKVTGQHLMEMAQAK